MILKALGNKAGVFAFGRHGSLKGWGSSYVGTVQTKIWIPAKGAKKGSKEVAVLSESFDPRTLSKMEIALDRACLILPAGSDIHRVRRIIAGKILECAHRGDKTLSGLTAAGYTAATQLIYTIERKRVG
jgi:hypothetical protein